MRTPYGILAVKGLNIDTLHTLTHIHIYQGRREWGFQGFLETPFKFKCAMDLYKIMMQEISG